MRKQLAIELILALGIILVIAGAAPATDCQPGTKSCKVVTMSDEEIQTLTGPNMIFDMARWASRPLGDLTDAWKKKIDGSPAGTVKADVPPPATKPQETK